MTILDVDRAPAGGVEALVAAKAGRRVAVCIPARNEAATLGPIVTAVDALRRDGLVDEVLVVDDGSSDTTADRARAAGATVLAGPGGPGKGEALARAVAATGAELLVFLDADVVRFSARFVTDLLAPLLHDPEVQLVKPAYRRPLDGRPGEGGRVTEILARPLLRRFFPELAGVAQPLAGESALRRSALTGGIALAGGYGVEIALLIDVYRRHGRAAVAEVDLGERAHRNRPLHQLRPHSDDVLAAVLARATHLA